MTELRRCVFYNLEPGEMMPSAASATGSQTLAYFVPLDCTVSIHSMAPHRCKRHTLRGLPRATEQAFQACEITGVFAQNEKMPQ
jgi:hypothetical protein